MVRAQQRQRAVARAVVGDDDLVGRERLGGERGEAVGQQPLAVVVDDDDGDAGALGHGAYSGPGSKRAMKASMSGLESASTRSLTSSVGQSHHLIRSSASTCSSLKRRPISLRRVADDDRVGPHVLGDDRLRPDDGAVADRHARHHRAAVRHPGVAADDDVAVAVGEAVLVGARQLEHRAQAVERDPLDAVQPADVEVRVGRDRGEVADDHAARVALVLDDVRRVVAHVAHDERAVGDVLAARGPAARPCPRRC